MLDHFDCNNSTHEKTIELFETIMHRGSDYQRRELLRTVAREVASLPLEIYEDFMLELCRQDTLYTKRKGMTEEIELTEDILDPESVGSEFVDDLVEK